MGLFDFFKEKQTLTAWETISQITLKAGYQAYTIENKSNPDLIKVIGSDGNSVIFIAKTNRTHNMVDFELMVGDFEFSDFEKKKNAIEQARQDLNSNTAGKLIQSSRTDTSVLFFTVAKIDTKTWNEKDFKALILFRKSLKENFQLRISERLRK